MDKVVRVTFSTNLDQDLIKDLKIEAIHQGKNVNEILEEIIKEYLEKKKQ